MNSLKERFISFFSKKENKVELPKEDRVTSLQEEIIIIKSLFDNDLIDLDEYVDKMKLLNDELIEVKKQENQVNNYADAIIRNEKGHILFLRRAGVETMFPNCWGLPGGKIENNEDAESAVKRETLEETNIDIANCSLDAKKTLDNGGVIWYYNCIPKEGLQTIILDNSEHYMYQYICKEDYDKYEFIADLRDVLNQIEERYSNEQKPVLIKAEVEDKELERAKEADLITLPKNISGTNCGNCEYMNFENSQCIHEKVLQKVSNRMCCIYWNTDGVIRKWEKNKN